jgi:hypothetical protein
MAEFEPKTHEMLTNNDEDGGGSCTPEYANWC